MDNYFKLLSEHIRFFTYNYFHNYFDNHSLRFGQAHLIMARNTKCEIMVC
jgi:hypothetical protein